MELEFIDTHFHFEEILKKNSNFDIDANDYKNFFALIDISTSVEDIEDKINRKLKINDIFKKEFLYQSLGIYPSHCSKESLKNDLDILEKNIKNFLFLGEIGIDYYHDYNKIKQKELFENQLNIAFENKKPIVLHTRDSFEDSINILSNFNLKQSIAHCFSGTYDYAKKFLDMGFFISFSGNITYKNSNLIDVLKKLPKDRILFETDSPYLSPQKKRGQINEPKNVINIYEFVSDALNWDIYELCQVVKNNFLPFIQ